MGHKHGVNRQGLLSHSDPGRNHVEEKGSVGRIKKHLKQAVEPDQARRIVAVSAGEVVPNHNHGDATGESDENESVKVGRLVAHKNPSQGKHKNRSNDPIKHQGGRQQSGVFENARELAHVHLGQGRQHHRNQADS